MDRGRRIIDNVFENEEQNFSNLAVEISGKSINGGVAKMLLENCEARLIQYQPGTIIPRHAHTDEVYKFILRGRMETEDEIQLTTGIGDYKCGGHEYGPWKVLDLTTILVLQPRGTIAVDPRDPISPDLGD